MWYNMLTKVVAKTSTPLNMTRRPSPEVAVVLLVSRFGLPASGFGFPVLGLGLLLSGLGLPVSGFGLPPLRKKNVPYSIRIAKH